MSLNSDRVPQSGFERLLKRLENPSSDAVDRASEPQYSLERALRDENGRRHAIDQLIAKIAARPSKPIRGQ